MSVTALAEYADMLFTRAHLELGTRLWWLEMRPSVISTIPQGYVALRCDLRDSKGELVLIEHRAQMHAIEQNAQVSVGVMETVVEHHLTEFMRKVLEAEGNPTHV